MEKTCINKIFNEKDFDLTDFINKKEKLKSSVGILKFACFSKINTCNVFLKKHPLIGYSFKRIFFGLITLFIAMILVFIVIRTITPDSQFLPKRDPLKESNQDDQSWINAKLQENGLDGNLFSQLVRYFNKILPFSYKTVSYQVDVIDEFNMPDMQLVEKRVLIDLGSAITTNSVSGGWNQGESVLTLINRNMLPSFIIGSTSVVLAYCIGFPLGVECARRKNRPFDNFNNVVNIFLYAIPALLIVLIIMYIGSPSILHIPSNWNDGDISTKLICIVCITVLNEPIIFNSTRRFVLDEMNSEYTKFAYAKGCSETRVFYLHILRNVWVRVLGGVPMAIIFSIFGTSLLVEKAWQVPGMSILTVDSLGSQKKDIIIFMGTLYIGAVATTFAALFNDLLVAIFDPRIKLS